MKVPVLTPVESSAIAALGHDPVAQRLFVKFRNGFVQSFAQVSDKAFQDFLAAPSKGNHYRKLYAGSVSHRHGTVS
jgi:hypothetical protein